MEKYFSSTKYINLYLKIISNANNLNRTKLNKNDLLYIYYESHHILPKSLFKEYSNLKTYKWNKVLLTAREHFICHILLMKHYKSIKDKNGYIKMSRAVQRLSCDGLHNSKIYASLKLNLSQSEYVKQKVREANTGKKHTDETKLLWSNQRKGKKKSEQTKQKMRKPKTQQHILNMNKAKINIIEVYDENNNLMYKNDNETKFIDMCKINNLPSASLKHSYLNSGKKLFMTKNGEVQAIFNNSIQFKGWYAIKL
jgi:translation elongation factor P/translation initiation factor 5A